MSASTVITQGFGSFGSANHVITLGYGFGAAIPFTPDDAQSTYRVGAREPYRPGAREAYRVPKRDD